MAERLTIARPYAKAIFAQALAGKSLADWSSVLQTAAAVSGDARVKPLFGNPHVSATQLAELFTDVGGASVNARIADQARNLVATLADYRRLQFLPEIAAAYERLRAEYERSVEVTVTSAVTLSAEQQQRLTAALAKRLSRDVRLHTEIDTKLRGGAVLKADDLVIDGSVAGGLIQLAARVAG
jgi:F-type H+-transporting ATPase subunit delta